MTPRTTTIERELGRRHIRGLFYLWRYRGRRVTYWDLERAIGTYATNTMLSLGQRGLITPANASLDGRFELTPAGVDVVRQLQRELGVTEQLQLEAGE